MLEYLSMRSSLSAPDSLRLALITTNELFSSEVVGKRNFAALDEVYTVDARILPPFAPMISGREAIKKFWIDTVQAHNAKSAVLESVDVIPTGDSVVEIRQAVITNERAGSPRQTEVKYVVYWRQEDGRWKWHIDIWNPNS